LIKGGGRTICSEIHALIHFVWNEEELPEEWMELISVPIYKKGDQTDCSNYTGISPMPTTYKILFNILLSSLTPYADSDTTGQLLIIYYAFIIYLRNKWKNNDAVYQFFIDFKKTYDSVRIEALCNILTEYGIPMKLVWLTKMCLNKTYSTFWVDKNALS
jgi:hypothetical protein